MPRGCDATSWSRSTPSAIRVSSNITPHYSLYIYDYMPYIWSHILQNLLELRRVFCDSPSAALRSKCIERTLDGRRCANGVPNRSDERSACNLSPWPFEWSRKFWVNMEFSWTICCGQWTSARSTCIQEAYTRMFALFIVAVFGNPRAAFDKCAILCAWCAYVFFCVWLSVCNCGWTRVVACAGRVAIG